MPVTDVIGSHVCPVLPLWQGEYVSCLLSLLRQMTDIHFQRLMENFQSKDELKVRPKYHVGNNIWDSNLLKFKYILLHGNSI